MRNVSHLLRVWYLLLLGHSLGEISDLEVGSASCWHDESGLAGEEALALGAPGADSWVDGPLAILGVLDGDCLCGGLAYHGAEGEILSL